MPKMKIKKRRLIKTSDKTPLSKTQPINKPQPDPEQEKEAASSSMDLETLLSPFTKDQLISFLVSAAITSPTLYSKLHSAADIDINHRKLFLHGLAWDTTAQSLSSALQSHGPIELCNVVTDHNTGKAKGFAFVVFKTRQGAINALKQPKKLIANRIVSCQLASVGPPPPGDNNTSNNNISSTNNRKIYVSNVGREVAGGRLREFFERFGEIEIGPLGFDVETGKSRGFALFVYKDHESAKKAVEEEYRMFDGVQLRCQMAIENKNNKGSNASVTTAVVQTVPDFAAVAAAAAAQQQQSLALLGQQQMLSSMYGGGMFVNPGLYNPLLAQSMMGLGGYGGVLGGGGQGQTLLGDYSGVGSATMGLQGLQQAYPDTTTGQASTSNVSGSFGGYPSFMWYGFVCFDILILDSYVCSDCYVFMLVFYMLFVFGLINLMFYNFVCSFVFLLRYPFRMIDLILLTDLLTTLCIMIKSYVTFGNIDTSSLLTTLNKYLFAPL